MIERRATEIKRLQLRDLNAIEPLYLRVPDADRSLP